ncbi:MAG: hypothetical protein OWQ50_07610 [Acidianus infernus]|nr:hypothetical protein [Acidianus infernus]
MENFRELIIDAVLSKRIKNFKDIESEGIRKRNICSHFNGKICRIKFEESVVSSWLSQEGITPHPVLCYICPYFSLKEEEESTRSSLFDIYAYYAKLKESVEKELQFIESRINNFVYSSVSLRRREELIYLLDDINEKIKITTELIKLSEYS